VYGLIPEELVNGIFLVIGPNSHTRGVKHLFDGNGLTSSTHLDAELMFKFKRVGGGYSIDDNRILKENLTIGTLVGKSGLAIAILVGILKNIDYHTE